MGAAWLWRAVRDDARLKALAVARGLAPDDVDAQDDDRRAAPAHARVVAGAGRDLLAGGRAPAAWRGRAG